MVAWCPLSILNLVIIITSEKYKKIQNELRLLKKNEIYEIKISVEIYMTLFISYILIRNFFWSRSGYTMSCAPSDSVVFGKACSVEVQA